MKKNRIKSKNFLLVLFLFVFTGSLFAQTDIFQSGTGSQLKFDEGSGKGVSYPFLQQLYALDKPIDPDLYKTGPGDVYNIGIWTSVPLLFPIQISMEGTAIIPSVGEVKVGGLSLTETKKAIIQKAKTKFVSSDVTVTLIAPRTFLVNVTGAVLKQGANPVRAGSRVSVAIRSANSGDSTIINRITERMSMRKILLYRQNEIIPVDLVKYMTTGNEKYNPLLAEGDRILVPRKDEVGFVSIHGGVTNAGNYEFNEGDSLSHLILYAGNTIESADLENVKISRLDENGNIKETKTVNLNQILNGKGPDVKLEKFDRIFVPTPRSLKRDYQVYIDGEVLYRGHFPIPKQGGKLSELLQIVGLKEHSAPENGFVIRNVRYENVEYLFPYLLRKNFGFSKEDSLYFKQEADLLSVSKFLSVNLEDIFNGKTDVELYDQDYIFIPSKLYPSVYVFGQVNKPGFISHKTGSDYQYYINSANGFSQLARRGDVKVIKKNTYSWIDADDAVIEPGDFIFVTKKVIREPSYYWNITKDIILTTGAIASTVATIVLISRTK